MADDDVLESALLDVTGIELADLDALPESTFRSCLAAVLAQRADLLGQYAAFHSAL